MNGPIIIDEINEHTTEAVNSIPAPFSLTDLMIDGYEHRNIKAYVPANKALQMICSAIGEGYFEGIYVLSGYINQAKFALRLTIDDKVVLYETSEYISSYTPFGFATADNMFFVYLNNNSPNYNIFGVTHNVGYFQDEIAHTLGSASSVNLENGRSFFRIKDPIHFKNSVKVEVLLGSAGNVYGGFYLKTGGGN